MPRNATKPTASETVNVAELTGWELELYKLHQRYEGRTCTVVREGAAGRKWSGKLTTIPEGLSRADLAEAAKEGGLKPSAAGLAYGGAKGKLGAEVLTGEAAANHANILSAE